jgi:hypothetical protein
MYRMAQLNAASAVGRSRAANERRTMGVPVVNQGLGYGDRAAFSSFAAAAAASSPSASPSSASVEPGSRFDHGLLDTASHTMLGGANKIYS